MPRIALSLENKLRFVLLTGTAFGLLAGVPFVIYMRMTGQIIPWPMIPMTLGGWLFAGLIWAWVMHAYMVRNRGKSRAFYVQLRDEAIAARQSKARSADKERIAGNQRLSVVLSGYTYVESLKLVVLSMYSSPARSLSSTVFFLMMAILALLNFKSTAVWPLNGRTEIIAPLLELSAAFVGVGFLFGSVCALTTQAAQRRVFARLGPTTLTFSTEGIVIKPELAPGSELAWSSIERAREVAGFILLARGGRLIVGLPKRMLSPTDLKELRRLLPAEKRAIGK